jgi:hypothetical protein
MRDWLILLILGATAGAVGLVFGGLPVTVCTLCGGLGRFTLREASDEVSFRGFRTGCVTQLETRVIYPALTSGCNLCSGQGRMTLLQRWKWTRGMIRVELGEIREEGGISSYCPEVDGFPGDRGTMRAKER